MPWEQETHSSIKLLHLQHEEGTGCQYDKKILRNAGGIQEASIRHASKQEIKGKREMSDMPSYSKKKGEIFKDFLGDEVICF